MLLDIGCRFIFQVPVDEIYHLAEIYIALRTHNVKRNRSLNKADCDLVILIVRVSVQTK